MLHGAGTGVGRRERRRRAVAGDRKEEGVDLDRGELGAQGGGGQASDKIGEEIVTPFNGWMGFGPGLKKTHPKLWNDDEAKSLT
jgi:hypothetical protein